VPGVADAVAEKLEPFLGHVAVEDYGWMDTKRAASYLGLSVTALHKLTAARRIPFHQDGPGAKCWFLRFELDRWRSHQSRVRFHAVSRRPEKCI
jgi:excisionase family DNA binding protein